MDPSVTRFSNTIERIYEAGLNPDLWPYALEAIAQEVGADKAQILYINPDDLTFSFACGYGFDPYKYDIGASKFRRYLGDDPLTKYAVAHLNEAFSDRRVIDPAILHTSGMQKNIRTPAGMEYILTTLLTDDSLDWTAICFFRGASSSTFLKQEEDVLTLYSNHIRRASHIQKAIAGSNHLHTIQSAVLDQIDTGLLIVDEEHNVLVSNEKAKKIIQDNALITLKKGHLVCNDFRENTLLHEAIDRALGLNTNNIEERKIAVRLHGSRSSGLLAVTTPLKFQALEEKKENLSIKKMHYTARLPNRKNAIISICDPSQYENKWSLMLEKLFNLTPDEAALAICLSGDLSLKEAAIKLNQPIGLTRAQLQSIFEKTDANRQASLVRLLMIAS